MSVHLRRLTLLLLIFMFLFATASFGAQKGAQTQKKGQGRGAGPPPAKVIVSTLQAGKISPQSMFTGTIYFKEVSKVAAETSGKVKTLYIEDGMRVKKGHLLIAINSAILIKDIEAKRASRGEVIAELKKARKDMSRAEPLYKKKLLSEKDFDKYRFAVDGLKNRSLSLKAEIERLVIERGYKSVRAPFNGIVMRKKVERGDWVNPGSVVATLGNNSEMYLVVNVPQDALPFIKKGNSLTVYTGGRGYKAVVHAIVPEGDIRTRTFPVKLLITENAANLFEGMEGSVRLPVGKEVSGLTINREALTSVMGTQALYAVIKGKAVMIPVGVTGYKGKLAGIKGAGLKAGMKIVTKGNERLRPGQGVIIMNKSK